MSYLFFDIDGTLVSHEIGLIPSAKEAIEKTQGLGHKVFIATGRHLGSLSVVADLKVDGILYCNGAGIQLDGKIIQTFPIPHDICSKTVFQAEERGGSYTLLSTKEMFLNIAQMDEFKKRALSENQWIKSMELFGAYPWTSYRNQDILKIDLGFSSEEIMMDFLGQMDDQLMLASTAGYHIDEGNKSGEITLKGINKGTAIQWLIQYLGASMEDTYGFGDSNNDLEMLKLCHVGVAMGNAFDSAKEIADWITKPIQEDGIAYALDHFGLIQD